MFSMVHANPRVLWFVGSQSHVVNASMAGDLVDHLVLRIFWIWGIFSSLGLFLFLLDFLGLFSLISYVPFPFFS